MEKVSGQGDATTSELFMKKAEVAHECRGCSPGRGIQQDMHVLLGALCQKYEGEEGPRSSPVRILSICLVIVEKAYRYSALMTAVLVLFFCVSLSDALADDPPFSVDETSPMWGPNLSQACPDQHVDLVGVEGSVRLSNQSRGRTWERRNPLD